MRVVSIVRRAGARAVAVVERQRWLDAPGYRVEHALALVFTSFGDRGRAVQDVLHGVSIGHPLHPALTDVPLGAWTAAAMLDVVDVVSPRPAGWQQAAQLAVGVGVVGGTGAALAGLTDWQHTHDAARRSGLVHGLLNTAALATNVWSWGERRHGRHTRGRYASALGYGLVLAGAYLGGDLVFRHRTGVDHSQPAAGPGVFVPVLASADLVEDTPRHVDCDGAEVVLLLRQGGRIDAVGGRCSHLGAPMAQGWLHRGELVCPWHGSRFDPSSGCALSGPATAPLTHYDVRVVAGQVELRRADAVTAPAPRGAATAAAVAVGAR